MPNAAAFTTQCRGIHFTREKKFWRQNLQCRSIEFPMPRHSTRTQNLFERPRPQCRSIQYRMPRHSKQNRKKIIRPIPDFSSFSLTFLPKLETLSTKTLKPPKNNQIPKHPTLQSTKILFNILQPNIQKPKSFSPISTKLIQKDFYGRRKSPKPFVLRILFNPSKCS